MSTTQVNAGQKVVSNSPASAASPQAERPNTVRHACRFCGAELSHVFLDLGMSPLCETYLTVDQIEMMEPFYPLKAYVCDKCLLVQLAEYESPEAIFSEYAYFSSYSDSWLKHVETYSGQMIERFGLARTARWSRWPATTATCCNTS